MHKTCQGREKAKGLQCVGVPSKRRQIGNKNSLTGYANEQSLLAVGRLKQGARPCSKETKAFHRELIPLSGIYCADMVCAAEMIRLASDVTGCIRPQRKLQNTA